MAIQSDFVYDVGADEEINNVKLVKELEKFQEPKKISCELDLEEQAMKYIFAMKFFKAKFADRDMNATKNLLRIGRRSLKSPMKLDPKIILSHPKRHQITETNGIKEFRTMENKSDESDILENSVSTESEKTKVIKKKQFNLTYTLEQKKKTQRCPKTTIKEHQKKLIKRASSKCIRNTQFQPKYKLASEIGKLKMIQRRNLNIIHEKFNQIYSKDIFLQSSRKARPSCSTKRETIKKYLGLKPVRTLFQPNSRFRNTRRSCNMESPSIISLIEHTKKVKGAQYLQKVNTLKHGRVVGSKSNLKPRDITQRFFE
ncbi:unnamed protein product [Moneuplotes crassus]|uniref:Uncharacterized protein n=1 Tax=Euplotes crassus TaxID=5936 RepID=A0AAD2CXT9_EUPCR|nr:unnamed protein product [Moneuplotes crassus]